MKRLEYVVKRLVCLLALAMFGACLPKPSQCQPPVPTALVQRCTLESNLISCGEQDAFALLPVVVGIIGNEINGAGFNAASVEAQLEAQGIHDVPCVLSALQAFIAPTNPTLAEKFHAIAAVALKKKGAHGIVDVKLRTGRTVSYVLQ